MPRSLLGWSRAPVGAILTSALRNGCCQQHLKAVRTVQATSAGVRCRSYICLGLERQGRQELPALRSEAAAPQPAGHGGL